MKNIDRKNLDLIFSEKSVKNDYQLTLLNVIINLLIFRNKYVS